MVMKKKTTVDLLSTINKFILPNAEWLFINSACNYCNGSLHNPVTALVSLLFLDASTDPFGGFADFSSAAASASFPSSQGRINLQIEMLLKWRKGGRGATWHLSLKVISFFKANFVYWAGPQVLVLCKEEIHCLAQFLSRGPETLIDFISGKCWFQIYHFSF